MKQFIKILPVLRHVFRRVLRSLGEVGSFSVVGFLIFSINIQSAEVNLQFTNFIDSVQLDVLLDQLIDIAGIQPDAMQKVERIIYIFEKRYSANAEQVNELLIFLKALEKEELYKHPAQYAKKIIENGLSRMRAHKKLLDDENKIKPNGLPQTNNGIIISDYYGDTVEEDNGWYMPTFYKCKKESLKAKNKVIELDLSDPIRGSINYLESLLRTIDSGTELSLIKQLILRLKNNTMYKMYFAQILSQLEKSEDLLETEIDNLELIFHTLFAQDSQIEPKIIVIDQRYKQEIVNNVISCLRSALEKTSDDLELSEVINQIITALASKEEDELEFARSILHALKENEKIQQDIMLAIDWLDKL